MTNSQTSGDKESTDYWLMRREMERRGHRFMSDCDSELLAVYTAHNLANGVTLDESLERSVSEIDGVFTYLVATRDQLGMAKDTMMEASAMAGVPLAGTNHTVGIEDYHHL